MTAQPQAAVWGAQDRNPEPASPGPQSPTPGTQTAATGAETPNPGTPANFQTPNPETRTLNSVPSAAELPPKRPRTHAQAEAGRRNLAKARRRWLDLRKTPGFEPSPRYYDAIHSNLKQAIQRKLHDHSGTYASCFRDGLSAISLQRSLKQAGESLPDYTSHVEWFVRIFTQGTEESPLGSGLASELAAGALPSGLLKLSLALGFVSWRRLRGFPLLAEWERLTVCQDLRLLAEHRQPGGAWSVLTSHLTAQQQAAWAQDHFLIWMIDLTGQSLGAGSALNPKLGTLENRFELLARILLVERDEPSFYERAQWGAIMKEYERWPAEVLGNPLVAASKVMKSLKAKRVTVAPVSGWRQPFGSGVKPEDKYQKQAREELAPDDQQRIAHARKQEAQGQPPSPASFEEFLPLVEAALGVNVGIGSATQARIPAPNGEGAAASDPDLREFAEALWERLEVYRRQAEQERRELRDLQQAYSNSLASEAPEGTKTLSPTQLAERLVRLFHASRRRAFNRAHAANVRLNWAIYRLLVKRYGEHEDFKSFKPPQPDNIGMLIHAMLLNQRGLKAEAEQLYEDYQRMEAEYQEMEAKARGHPAAVADG